MLHALVQGTSKNAIRLLDEPILISPLSPTRPYSISKSDVFLKLSTTAPYIQIRNSTWAPVGIQFNFTLVRPICPMNSKTPSC
jgi:hypothetical protein